MTRRRVDATFCYRVTRAAHGKRRALTRNFTSETGAHAWAFHTLNEPAEIVEWEMLPLGCEAIRRVGVIDVDGRITWRKERRRPRTARYLADELARP